MWSTNIVRPAVALIALASVFFAVNGDDDVADQPATIRVAVIWHETSFSSEGSRHKSSFMDGFYFFNKQLEQKEWVAQLGDPQTYQMEMVTLNTNLKLIIVQLFL